MAEGEKARESLRQYLAEANGWETDSVARANRSAKLGWFLGFLGLAIGLCGVVAVMGLTPLKQVVPVVIRVDNATGITEVIEQLSNARTNYQEAINRYFLQKYVRYREAFNRATAEHQYTAVGLMSARGEQASYVEWFSPRNPASPLNTHGEGHRTEISIRSTSFLAPETALVRFIREQHLPGTARPILSYWAATITFTYQNPPTSQKDREINPLGFQVTGYRIDPESLTAVEGQPAPRLVQQPQPMQPSAPSPPVQPAVPQQPQPIDLQGSPATQTDNGQQAIQPQPIPNPPQTQPAATGQPSAPQMPQQPMQAPQNQGNQG